MYGCWGGYVRHVCYRRLFRVVVYGSTFIDESLGWSEEKVFAMSCVWLIWGMPWVSAFCAGLCDTRVACCVGIILLPSGSGHTAMEGCVFCSCGMCLLSSLSLDRVCVGGL